MNRIHRKVEYALIALKHMRGKNPGERTTVKDMATQYRCPHDVLARVLQTLASRGVLKSEQGVHGGYLIAKDLNRVSFYDLLEMILGPMEVARCLQEPTASADSDPKAPFANDEAAVCELRETCNIVSPIQLLNRKMSEFYRNLSVAELIEAGRSLKSRESAKVNGAQL